MTIYTINPCEGKRRHSRRFPSPSNQKSVSFRPKGGISFLYVIFLISHNNFSFFYAVNYFMFFEEGVAVIEKAVDNESICQLIATLIQGNGFICDYVSNISNLI